MEKAERKQYNMDSITILATVLTGISKDEFIPLIPDRQRDKPPAIRHGWTRMTMWEGDFSEADGVEILRDFIENQESRLEEAKKVLAKYDSGDLIAQGR